MRTKLKLFALVAAIIMPISFGVGVATADLQLLSSDQNTPFVAEPTKPAQPAQPSRPKVERTVPAPTKAPVAVQVVTSTPKPTARPVVKYAPVVGKTQVGTATWYDYHPGGCASRTIPRSTVVSVKNLDNGRSATCKVNDYGPEAWTGHIIDLERGVFAQLAPTSVGVISVRVSW